MNSYENFWFNTKEIFRLSLKELIFCFLIAIPFSLLLFWVQSKNKVYQLHLLGGKAVITKFCEEYMPGQNFPLINPGNFEFINKILDDRNLYKNDRNYRATINYDISKNQYNLTFFGSLNDDDSFKEEADTIFTAIKKFEYDNYENLYKNVVVKCDGVESNIFQKTESVELIPEIKIKKKNSNRHIFINSISPLFIIYFIMIIIRRIRFIIEKVGIKDNF